MTSIETRLLAESDWQQWKTLRLESLQDSPEAFGGAFSEESLKDDSFFMGNITNNKIFGAFDGTRLVGSVGFSMQKMERLKHRGKIFGVFITPSARGQGISRTLMQLAIDFAKDKVVWLEIHVWTKNPVAFKLYSSLGFVTYATRTAVVMD